MEENKSISFLRTHWKKGVYALLVIACIAIWSERFYQRGHSRSGQDYLTMKQLFDRFKQAQPLPLESIEEAERLVKRHPELHPSYDGMLAQAFFAMNNPAQAAVYAEAACKRVAPRLHPHYAAFAQATTLIAKGALTDAYQVASDLEMSLSSTEGFDHLRAFNLLRLVFLSETVNQRVEQEQWRDRLHHHRLFETISALFQQGDLSLDRYLDNRLT